MERVGIVGSRDFPHAKQVQDYVNSLPNGDIIISGGAVGVDTMAEQAAKARGMSVYIFKPEYKKYDRGATFIRNKQIVDASDRLVAFWDGKSKGTQHSIGVAIRTGKRVLIISPYENEARTVILDEEVSKNG